jgi:hypothetical protein
MRPKSAVVLAIVCCTVIVSPSLAAMEGTPAPQLLAAIFAPADSATLPAGTPEPSFLSGCTVQVQCADNSVVSCSGNSTCSTGGTNNRCVVCDGVQHGCCPQTCCEVCDANFQSCIDSCNPPTCSICGRVYTRCTARCGCP